MTDKFDFSEFFGLVPEKPIPPKPLVHQNGHDDVQAFLDTGLVSPETEPQPLAECVVPTTPVRPEHLKIWTPFCEGPIKTDRELRRCFYQELFQRGPYSLKPFLENGEKVPLRGAYAIYYVGDLWDAYALIRSTASILPIYAGQAIATVLSRRISEHAESIRQVGLGIENFTCRVIGLPDWLNGEQILLNDFSPIWNDCLRGFGKHQQATDIRAQGARMSIWDRFHLELTNCSRKGAGVLRDRVKGEHSMPSILENFKTAIKASLTTYHHTMTHLDLKHYSEPTNSAKSKADIVSAGISAT
jgi:hypothetical protein